MITLSPERPEEGWQVEALYDLCFAPGREGLSSYRLRGGVAPAKGLSHVARDEFGELAGAIRYWPVLVGARAALLLGPVAVHPTRQGEGIGGMLIEQSLERAVDLDWERVMLVGDAPYYKRFGFEPLSGVVMPPPTNPARVLGRALTRGAWDGVEGDVTKVT